MRRGAALARPTLSSVHAGPSARGTARICVAARGSGIVPLRMAGLVVDSR